MRIDTPDADDADELAALWVALAADQRRHGSRLLAEENRAGMRERIVRRVVTGDAYVAREPDRIVGFVTFGIHTGSLAESVTRGTIQNVYVVPDRRDEGIGSDLLAAAEAALAEEGAGTITLEVMAENEAARRFYRRHGYDPHRLQLSKPTEDDPG